MFAPHHKRRHDMAHERVACYEAVLQCGCNVAAGLMCVVGTCRHAAKQACMDQHDRDQRRAVPTRLHTLNPKTLNLKPRNPFHTHAGAAGCGPSGAHPALLPPAPAPAARHTQVCDITAIHPHTQLSFAALPLCLFLFCSFAMWLILIGGDVGGPGLLVSSHGMHLRQLQHTPAIHMLNTHVWVCLHACFPAGWLPPRGRMPPWPPPSWTCCTGRRWASPPRCVKCAVCRGCVLRAVCS